MFRLYRPIEQGEFFVVFGDTAQGGSDKNFAQFMSKDRLDIPLVFSMHGVAAEATPYIHQALEWIYDKTGVRPVFAFERQNGGVSEMHNLMKMNRNGKYILYQQKDDDGNLTDRYGWDTNAVTRSKMLGEWKIAYETGQIKLYDAETLDHHKKFIVTKRNRPEAAPNMHDDGVMSCAGVWQLAQTEHKPTTETYHQDDYNFNFSL